MEIKKSKVSLNTCTHLGHAKLDGYNISTYCTLCFENKVTDDIHRNLDCKNCPDFEAYKYEVSWIGEEI